MTVAGASGEDHALFGRLRLSLPSDIAAALLGPALIQFQAKHRRVLLDIVLADCRVALVEEGFDVAVRIGALGSSGLMQKRLGRLSRRRVASPDLLHRLGPIATPADLARKPGLMIRRNLVEWTLLGPDDALHGMRPAPAFIANC